MTKSDAEPASVGVHEAKTSLSRLLRIVEGGGEVRILRGAHPVARLVPVEGARPARRLGTMKGVFDVPDDFDETDEGLIDAFESGPIVPR